MNRQIITSVCLPAKKHKHLSVWMHYLLQVVLDCFSFLTQTTNRIIDTLYFFMTLKAASHWCTSQASIVAVQSACNSHTFIYTSSFFYGAPLTTKLHRLKVGNPAVNAWYRLTCSHTPSVFGGEGRVKRGGLGCKETSIICVLTAANWIRLSWAGRFWEVIWAPLMWSVLKVRT